VLHLHRFQHHQRAAGFDALAGLRMHGDDAAVHRRGEAAVGEPRGGALGRVHRRVAPAVRVAVELEVQHGALEHERCGRRAQPMRVMQAGAGEGARGRRQCALHVRPGAPFPVTRRIGACPGIEGARHGFVRRRRPPLRKSLLEEPGGGAGAGKDRVTQHRGEERLVGGHAERHGAIERGGELLAR
jgi:hypothetical protein